MNIKSVFAILALLVCSVMPSFSQIQAKQSIRITVTGIPLDEKGRIDGDYPVGDNGSINMPFIGGVHVAGLKPEDVAVTLQARYKSAGIYRNPTFQVFATTGGSGVVEEVVHVGGQVRRTGPVKFTQGLTLWSAIQSAGGPTEFGSMRRVTVTRNGKITQHNCDETKAMQYLLQPDDLINVPQKDWLNR